MNWKSLGEVRLQSLEGLGASYRMKGYFELQLEGKPLRVNFKGIAFGGHYGGHNVSVEISRAARKKIETLANLNDNDLESLLSEIQRRLLNGEMVVDYSKIRPSSEDALGMATS